MIIFSKKKILTCSLFFSLFSSFLFSETFRVGQCHTVTIKEEPGFSATASLGLNDAIGIYFPAERNFIEGLEIKMEIPEQTALWRDCCGAYIYENIKPAPASNQIDFSGNKVFFGVLPGKLSWILQIPFSNETQFKTNQYTKTIEKTPDISGNFVFLRLQQIMKGVPDEVMNSQITFTVRPILSDKGMLNIKFNYPELSETVNSANENNITVFINDSTYSLDDIKKGILINTGIHNISVISENYRTEVRKVRIDQAKKTDLIIDLKSIEPSVVITAPDGAEVFIDEQPVEDFGNEIILTEGDHKISCKIGDYEIIRSLSVFKGRTYKINLTVDLQISED